MKNKFKTAFRAKYPNAKVAYSGNVKSFFVRNFSFSMVDEYHATKLAGIYGQSLIFV